MISNGLLSLVHVYGRGAGSGMMYGLPMTRWQVKHFVSSCLTICRAGGTQYLCLSAVTVHAAAPCVWQG